jgi:hypothetical protein
MTDGFQSRKYKRKACFVKDLVKENTGETVSEFIQRKNWSIRENLCLNLLDNDLNDEDRRELSVLEDLNHLKDDRSNAEYALDLITAWILEDLISEMIEKETCHASADKDREFLENPEANSDLEINLEDRNVPLEIVNDYTGFWKNQREMSNLRDHKFQNLKDENALILGIDLENRYILLIPARNAEKEGKKYNPRINKQASIINLEEQNFHGIENLNEVVNEKLEKMN